MDHLMIEETIDEMTTTLSRLNSTHGRNPNSNNNIINTATPRTTLAPAPELRRTATNPYPPRTSQYSISAGTSPVSPSMSDGGPPPWAGFPVDTEGYFKSPGEPSSLPLSHFHTPSPNQRPRRPSRASSVAAYAYPHPGTRLSIGSGHTSHRRSSSTTSTASYIPGTSSPFPAPSKPLPSLPPISARSSQRGVSSHSQLSSSDKSSVDVDRFSQSSGTSSSHPSRSSLHSVSLRPPPLQVRPPLATTPAKRPQPTQAPPRPARTPEIKPAAIAVDLWKTLSSEKKKKGAPVFFLDISATGTTVAIKHGNNLVKFWNVETGGLQASVKFSAYTEAHVRSRDYLIRSHAILSDTAKMAAIATRFGRSLEIWNWEKKKKLQLIDDVDRWAAGRFESYDAGWSPVAAYRGADAQIDLYAATDRAKKPFAKVRTIDLNRSNLPFVPQYPELALSPTSPLLVAAAGPRTPRAGNPPPDRETLLVVWEIHDYRDITHEPHRMVRPWQHKELDTAIPCNLVTYGQIVVSIWIPASHRVVSRPSAKDPNKNEWKLAPTPVPFKHVLVWDMSENSTRSFGIPNVTACVSPDCRYVAYCDIGEAASPSTETEECERIRMRRGKKLAILDALTGEELWCVRGSVGSVGSDDSIRLMEQFGDITTVTNMDFSADARFIAVGYADGNTSVYDVRELITKTQI